MFYPETASSAMVPLFRQALTRCLPVLSSIAALSTQGVQGAEVTQSRAFSVNKTASGSGTLVVSDATASGANGLTGTGFTPFDPDLGTLTSFTITWSTSLTASGIVSPSASGSGGLTLQIGGDFYLNSDQYSGTGGGNGNGGVPGSVINPVVATAGESKVFQVAGAGTAYNPAILTAVTGSSNFSLSYLGGSPGSPGNLAQIGHSALSNLSATYEGTVTLAYTYTPPQPVSATLNGASGSVPNATNYSTNTGLILSLGFEAEYLVVGGGGSGGTAGGSGGQNTWGAGGGGAGGLLMGAMNLDPGSYNVTVGAGGLAAAYNAGITSTGRDGLSSLFDSVTALGGGGGAGGDNANGGDGRSGASGGGGGSKYANPGGSGTSPQGYAGGSARNGDTSSAGSRTAGGGGGGAGGAGKNGGPSNSVAGAGGVGTASEITGTSVTYGGGGGGGARDTYSGQQSGAGGTGGGGAGSTQGNATSGGNGLGGGGGGSGADGKGGDGGSGLVIVRYKGTPAGTGGTVSAGTGSATGYTLHTFSTTGASALDLSGLILNDRLGTVLSGVISGSRDLTFSGPGALTLTAANTFSGNTIITAGRIVLGNPLALQNSAIDTSSAGRIDATGVTTPTFGGLNGSTNLSTLFSSGYPGITSLTLNTESNANSYSGVIADGATGMNLVKTGSGTQALTGTNTYTGSTTVSGGILAVGGNSLPNSGDVFINGGKVAATGTEVVRALYFDGGRQPLGTYGATGSGATYIDDVHFSGTAGVVQVTEGFATSTTSLSSFFTKPNLASASQSFTVNGQGLSGSLVVTAPAGFEVSNDNSTFSSSLTLATQPGFIESVYGGNFNTAKGTIWTFGSGGEFPNLSAFAAITGNGSVITWGGASTGGNSAAVAGNLTSNVKAVYSAARAFAALKVDGSVITWGDASYGGDSTAVAARLTSDVTAVYSAQAAFAALKSDGSLVTWGHPVYGGNSAAVADKLTSNVTAVYSNQGAFSALKSNGSVVTWGAYVGDTTAVADKLTSNVKAVYPNSFAFAALKIDGSVVTWGLASAGGGSAAVAPQLNSNVTAVYSTIGAFAALKSDGSVVTWGQPGYGGDSAAVADKLTSNVTAVYSTQSAFAAVKTDGSVVTWGDASTGGDSAAVADKLNSNVTVVYSTAYAFAALKTDGSLVTWGSPSSGNSSAVADKLTSDVTAVYSNLSAFAALKTDGSVVTWGSAFAGGDSAAVADGLISKVTMVYSTPYAFAALKTDGSVVTWGSSNYGGTGGPAKITDMPATLYIRLASAASAGPVTGNLTLTHSGSATQTVALSGTITPPLSPSTQTIDATYGTAISPTTAFSPTGMGGTVTYIVSPSLPAGLSFNSATGVISGTPTAVKTTSTTYTITGTGASGGSASATVAITVAKAPLTVVAMDQSRAYGEVNPSFSVSFSGLVNGDAVEVISGAASLTTTATPNSAPGTYAITASVGTLGATNYSFGEFTAGTMTILKASQSISISPLANTVPLKDLSSVNLSATSTSGLPVTLSLGAGSAASLSGTVGSYSLTDIGTTGIVTVLANQAGDDNYAAATQVVATFDVTKTNQTISFGSLADKTFGDTSFDLAATADSGLVVSFSRVSGPAEIQGSTVTLTGGGTVVIRASQPGSDLYNEASAVIRTFTVTPAAQTITFGTLAAVTYGDAPLILGATSNSGLPVTYSIVSGPATLNGITLAPTAAGTVTIRASQAGDDDHSAAEPVERTLVVNRKTLTVTGATALDKTADETTAAQLVGAELSGVIAGDDVTLGSYSSGTFAQAAPGSGLVVTTTMTLEGADAGSYILTQPTITGNITAEEIIHTHQELWRFENFGSYDSVDSGADSADPDHDGLNNLLEYALGTAPNSSGVMLASLALNGANLEYTYTRSTAAKENGINYQIEWSDTLEAGSWSTETVTQEIQSTHGALETVKASVPAGSGGKRFLRLRVVK